jgi:C4-dicarboxylate-specific signal transduction histidine kinase
MWVGREPATIAAGLADALLGSLQLEFAFVRLCDPKGGQAIELARGHAWKAFPEWLRTRLGDVGQFSCKEIVTDLGGAEPCRGVVIPIGVNAKGGLVAAACARTDFPSEIDHLLLSVAANHAAAAFQNACLRNELDARVAELRQARDELEMKVAERTAELRRSEAYLAEAQRLAHIGSWAGNILTREILHSSEEHSRLYAFDPDRGLPSFEELHQRVHPEDRVRLVEAFERASHAGTDVDVQYRIVLPDGTTKYVQAVGHPVSKPPGKLGEFVGFLMDVTERRQADEERERLRQAQTELAHINRVTMMGELAASIAHEIKQPISAAHTNAKTCLRWLGRDQPDIEEAREAVSRIVQDVTRASEIINRIRILFKKGEPEREWIDVNEVIREMTSLLCGEAERHGIVIHTELAPELPYVLADRVQLQQVFMNLMLNGIDAIAEANVAGDLTIKSESSSNDQVLISISDTGIGLPPERADKVFEAFFTTKPQGTGMGLSISRSIIESHGGRLWAIGNPDRGATFQFTLPLEARASSASAG